jgi:hypothetical protein
MNKSFGVILLVGVNLALLAILVGTAYPPPAAMAQPVGGAGNYLLVCGNTEQDSDAIYLLDLANRNLHTFTVRKGQVRLEYRGFRDLEQDFR